MGKYIAILTIGLMISTCFTTLSISVETIYNPSNDINNSYHIKLETLDAPSVATKLRYEGFDVLKETITENSFELIVNYIWLKKLEEKGYNITILETSRPFREIQGDRLEDKLDVPSGYPDLSDVIQIMEDTASNHPSICKVFDLTNTYGISPTFEDRHIYAMKISDNVNQDEDEPTFLMVSCHHCREIVTTVIALHAIEQFSSKYGSDPEITELVNKYEIWIAPVWNPDGYEYVFNVNNMWRKNRREGYGVDLNRNYPFGWNGGCSGSSNKNSETYKGPSPASEPETQTMMAFSKDQHFTKVLDYHSYGREVLYSYHPSCHSHPFHSFFRSEAEKISTAAGYQGSIRSPSAEGENYEWQIWNNGTYANLMETHTSFQPSYSSAESEAEKVWPATLRMLNRPISISGNVKDYVTKEPIETNINLVGIEFTNDEIFKSEKKFGRYHLFLPPSEYDIEFSADGYISQRHKITVTLESAEVLDIFLKRPNNPPGKPVITGPLTGYTGINIDFSVLSEDPNDDNVSYFVDWGDGNIADWTDFYSSGDQIKINYSWDIEGQYAVRVKAKDIYENESIWSETINIEIERRNIPPDTPEKPEGPTSGIQKVSYEFNFTTTDPDDDNVSYFIDWGDDTTSSWLGPFNSGDICKASHIFKNHGTYGIKVKAKDIYGNESLWSKVLPVEIFEQNNPPEIPDMPIGLTKGKKEIEYNYKFKAIDPDDDKIFYFIDWGDGSDSRWLGPYDSGKKITKSHSWSSEDLYKIRVKVKDIKNRESSWSENLSVNITDFDPPGPVIRLNLSIDKGIFNMRLFLGRINAIIENIGQSVSDVNWSIFVTGGILDGVNITKKGRIDTLKSGKSEVISSWSLESKIVRKFGSIDIKLEATANGKTFSENTTGFVLGRIVLIF